jgi:hypothetical protein
MPAHCIQSCACGFLLKSVEVIPAMARVEDWGNLEDWGEARGVDQAEVMGVDQAEVKMVEIGKVED